MFFIFLRKSENGFDKQPEDAYNEPTLQEFTEC